MAHFSPTATTLICSLILACTGTDKGALDGRPDGGTADGGTADGGTADGGTADGGTTAAEWPVGAVVLDHVTVVDARGVVEDAAVVLAGDEIWAVVAAGQTWPDDATVQDWSHSPSATVIPGLIDAHVHLFLSGTTWWVGDTLADNLAAQLSWGVTGVFDLGSPVELYAIRDRIAAGELVGPRILSSGPMITAELSHPCENVPDENYCRFVDGDGAEVVAELADADVLKAALADAAFTDWPTPRLDVEDLAEVAAASEQMLFVHVDEPHDATDAIAAGADVLAHTVFSVVLTEDERAEVGEVPTTSTAGAFASASALSDGSLLAEDLTYTPAAVIEAWEWSAANLDPAWVAANGEWEAVARENLAGLITDGAPVLAGSDAGYWYVPHGLALHRELEMLVEAGMTPLQALAAATSEPASLAGWTDLGFVDAGYRADLVVLEARPDLDISATRQIAAVLVGGQAWSGDVWVAAGEGTASEGSVCLDDRDCADGACDLVDHICRAACDTPYDRVGSCDDETWCMPADGVETTRDAVCHPDDDCDLYTQDCSPASYGQACTPVDVDSNRCLSAGDRSPGQTCSYSDPDYFCEVGSFCSWVDYRCYQLCDPDDFTPSTGCARCERQVIEGEGWFGICG